MSSQPTVSVIIVNWNGRRWLKNCLHSLTRQRMPLEIIVVDNGSSDGSQQYIKRAFPSVRMVENQENIGFAPANNQGAALSRAEYLLFLNNDTVVTAGALSELVQFAKRQNATIVQPKILLLEHPDHFDVVSAHLTPLGFLQYEGLREFDFGQYDEPKEIFSPKGACMLVKRAAFERVGGFDADFFAYAEETDLAWRILLAGGSAFYDPKAVIYHAVGSTSKQLAYRFIHFHSFKNRLLTLRTNLSLGQRFWRLPLHYLTLIGLILVTLVTGRFQQTRAITDAVVWNIRNRKLVKRRRELIRKIRTVSDRDLLGRISAHWSVRTFFAYAGNFLRAGVRPIESGPGILQQATFHRFILHMIAIYKEHLPLKRRLDIQSTMWAEQIRDNFLVFAPYLPKGGKALDLGCGKGHNGVLLKLLGYDVQGIDLPLTLGEQLGIETKYWQRDLWKDLRERYGVQLNFGSGAQLPFPAGHFDLVLTYAVLEHVEPQSAVVSVLAEIKRVLKPGGVLLIYDLPRARSWAEKLADVLRLGSHEHRWTRSELKQAISKAGLKLEIIDRYGTFPVHPLTGGLLTAFNGFLPLWVGLEKLLRKTVLIRWSHFIRAVASKSK